MAAIPLVLGFLCFFLVSILGQETEPSWHWIMADSRNASLVCPGRCLAVNDSAYPGDYEDKEVGFGPCRSSSSSSSSSTSQTNNNQQWLYDGPGSPGRIRINASEADPPVPLCLQPRRAPGSSDVSLTVTKCGAESDRNQSWVVANDSIASLAFDPPRYLAMQYKLSADGAWRRASLVPKNDAGLRSKSQTNVFSMVAYTEDVGSFPPLNISNMTSDSANFIQNGGFEQSSFDFGHNVTEFDIDENELFAVCHWVVRKSGIQLRNAAGTPPAEGNQRVLLKGGIFMQTAQTRPGAMYTVAFNIAVAKPDPSESVASLDGNCNGTGTETVSVNPFPSTNVKVSLDSRSRETWEAKHFSFQAVGSKLQLAFTGCSTCGCYLDDVNLMQTSDPVPLPSPPPFKPRPPSPPPDEELPYFMWRHPPLPPPPPPPQNSSTKPEPAQHNLSDPRPPFEFPHKSRRLSNGAVAGLLVGSSMLFFLMGATCFGVLGLTKKPKSAQEVDMVRPPEWSIQTTTPPRSERLGNTQLSSSNAPANPPLRPDPSPPSSTVATHSASSRP